MILRLAAFLFLALAANPLARGAAVDQRGSEVVVVFNSRVPESKDVADHYAKRRNVPARQVVGLSLPTTETMTRAQYLEQLEGPLFRFLETNRFFTFGPATNRAAGASPNAPAIRRMVGTKIRYAVLCYGVPLKILPDPKLVEAGVDQLRPELQRNEAAVDSQLVLLPVHEQNRPWTGPASNPFYGATNGALLNPTNGILIVSRLDGPSAAIARGLVDKAMEAETNGLWGRAYFDARGYTNGAYAQGDQWMRQAAQAARIAGYEIEIDDRPETFTAGFPMSQIAIYMGWYDQMVTGPFTRPTVEFMPGAFAYHLYSFAAQSIRGDASTWVATLLRKGATATFGATEEPYLGGTPDLSAFLSRWLIFKMSFGEAAWAGQAVLSWQITVIGDPLYQPTLRPTREIHEDLERRKSPLVEWTHLNAVNLNMVAGTTYKELVDYLGQTPATRQSAVLSEKLGDLHGAQNKLFDALDYWEVSLKRNPSPVQKLRLLLKLARGRLAYGPDTAALTWYQRVLKDYPDYPDILPLYREILPLAKRTGNKEEIERCEKEIQRLSPPTPTATNTPVK
jgi:uncharacterized protein (TIGR03790 family)